MRPGWKTDSFNKFGEKVVGEKGKLPRRLSKLVERGFGQGQEPGRGAGPSGPVHESCCFSVVHGYGDKPLALDLVARSPQAAALWVRALQQVVVMMRSLDQQKRFNMSV